MISRYTTSDRSKNYRHEALAGYSCDTLMDRDPLVVDIEMNLCELTDMLIRMEPHHLTNGFIITNQGIYAGTGSGHALLREISYILTENVQPELAASQ
jgi:hypothetical protein